MTHGEREGSPPRSEAAADPAYSDLPRGAKTGGLLGRWGGLPVLDPPEENARLTLRRVALALAIGISGGAAFAALGAPLAWMLGAMAASTVAAFSGLRFAVPPILRTVMIAVLGVMLGAAFTPEMADRIGQWAGGVAVLAAFIGLTTLATYLYYRRIAGFDRPTAYFSSTPGGLSEMAIVGESYGADIRVISLIHATRILIVVSLIPFYFRFVKGLDVPTLPPSGTPLLAFDPTEGLLLAAAAGAGVALARLLKVPAGALVGPMVLSAGIHLAGWSTQAPPLEIIAAAQVVVGTAIGARFTGLRLAAVWPYVVVAAVSALMMIAAAAAVGFVMAPLLGLTPEGLVLALAPGGLAEMGLIALSLGIDVAFVSSMHILRIAMVILAAPAVFRAATGPPTRRSEGPK